MEAESCFEVGEIEKGEATFSNLVNDYPDNIWGYIGWGDVYVFGTKDGAVEADHKRAKEIYELSLDKDIKAKEDKKVILGRLAELNS